jgi:hypothetical protein
MSIVTCVCARCRQQPRQREQSDRLSDCCWTRTVARCVVVVVWLWVRAGLATSAGCGALPTSDADLVEEDALDVQRGAPRNVVSVWCVCYRLDVDFAFA